MPSSGTESSYPRPPQSLEHSCRESYVAITAVGTPLSYVVHASPCPPLPLDQVESLVMTMIENARKLRIPVTGATIEAYGVAAKKKLVAAASATAAEKGRLEAFNVSGKWVRNLVLRNELVSKVLHGEAGSVDADATAEGLRKVREACQEYELANIFNVDETGIFYKLLPNRTHLSQAENRKTARGTKGMKAKYRVSAYM